MSLTAFVAKLSTKSGQSGRGPWTAYSMKLQNKDGTELPGWYQCGFSAPPCKEGDYIKLEATAKGSNWTVTEGSIRVSKNPPAAPPPAKGGNASGSYSGGKGATVKKSDLFGEIGGYNTEDDIRRMSYSAARSDAIKVAGLLAEKGFIPFVKADAKAGKAKNFDLLVATIDKLTVEFFFDAATGRKLETVADPVAPVKEEEPLPDVPENEAGLEDGFDDSFEDDDDDFE